MAYAWDDASQLTGITYTRSDGVTVLGTLTYAYDNAGRPISQGGSLAATDLPAAVTSVSYDAANRITSWNGTAYSYDSNGNLVSDGSSTYTWNSRNQLAAISGATSASFSYDGLGRRRARTVGGTTTQYLYDGQNPIQELAGGSATANLLAGPQLDEWYGRTNGGASVAYLTDALGSTRALADASQVLATSYTYEPYGKTSVTGVATTNSLAYTGRENDGTGLYYYRARYYSPSIGRFVSEDPIGLAGGDNLYAYVDGNPLSYSDPLGLWSFNVGLYFGWGGGVTIYGTGNPLLGGGSITAASLQAGYGLAAGFSVTPNEDPPGSPCVPSGNSSLGVFASAGGNLGPLNYGWGGNAGFSSNIGGNNKGGLPFKGYAGGGIGPAVGSGWGLKSGYSAGIQLTWR